jgi:hypothetical protein
MGVKDEVAADFTFKPQFFAVGGKQQFDGRGVEPDTVVKPLYSVFSINAFYREHGP